MSTQVWGRVKGTVFNACKFSNHDSNKFISLLQKVVYPYEYIDHWDKCNETSLTKREDFYSRLNMDDVTDADYVTTLK